jgi:hypothetical protein
MAVLGARSSACPRVRRHDFQHWRADADRLAGIRDNGGDHLGALHADLDGTPRLAVGDLLINLEGLGLQCVDIAARRDLDRRKLVARPFSSPCSRSLLLVSSGSLDSDCIEVCPRQLTSLVFGSRCGARTRTPMRGHGRHRGFSTQYPPPRQVRPCHHMAYFGCNHWVSASSHGRAIQRWRSACL